MSSRILQRWLNSMSKGEKQLSEELNVLRKDQGKNVVVLYVTGELEKWIVVLWLLSE